MHITIPPQPLVPQGTISRKSLRLSGWTLAAVLAAGVFLAASALAGQAPATAPASAPAHKPVHPQKRPGAAHPPATPAKAAAAPATPVAPEAPHWPANDRPVVASVLWNSQGLSITASNSSLQQILKDVSTATGAKVEGLGADERVFGSFGPGKAREVLSKLLEGSGYNVLMIGDQGPGVPRQIVLTTRQAGGAQPAANPNQPPPSDEDADADDQPQPAAPVTPAPIRPVFNPGGQARTPQQMMQDMQQRQQQMQQNNPRN